MTENDILEVYRRTMGPLYAFVSRRCGGERALAEDVVQETWLRAVDAWRARGVPDAPAAWLTAVARNLLIDHFRRKKPVVLDVSMEAVLAAVDDGFATESDDIAKLIQWGLAQLPRDEAGILEQFHFDERSTASIAKDLHLSDRAVEGRLRRARLKLRRVIDRTLTRQGAQR